MSGWRVSSYSANNGACIEVASGPAAIAVRDTKLPGSPVLAFAPGTWERFTASLKDGPGQR
jgi:hypothetical protein